MFLDGLVLFRLRPLKLSKKVLLKLLLTALLVFTTGLAQAAPPYKVQAYLATNYVGNSRGKTMVLSTDIPWSDITIIYAFSANVNSNETISYSPLSAYTNLVTVAHSNGVRAYLAVGGGTSGIATAFVSSTSSPANITSFVSSIMATVNAGGFDGVDIDWEFPNINNASPGETTQFMNFMSALSTSLRGETSSLDGAPLGLDFFTSAGYQNCGVNWSTIGSLVDNAILSGYSLGVGIGGVDYDAPINVPVGTNLTDACGHTDPFSIAGQVTRLNGLGFPIRQMILGCPFYLATSSYPQPDIYVAIQNAAPSPAPTFMPLEMESIYNDYTSNSADDAIAFCNKISWALGQGMPGIALFELSQACPYGDAPVVALWNSIGNPPSCYTATPTSTITFTPTITGTPTPCMVGGVPCTSTATPTATNSPTVTATPTATPTVLGVTVPLIYPNPTSGQPVNLRLPLNVTADVKVQIFTVAFRKVWEQTYSQVPPATPINVSLSDQTGTQLSNGLYYVVAITSKGTFKSKLLILR